MLVLTRKPGEKIIVANAYEVAVVSVERGVVKLAFGVDRSVYLMPGNVEIDVIENGDGGFHPIRVTRKVDDSVLFNSEQGEIEVLIVSVKGEAVRVGIKAPRNVTVHRQEVWEMIQAENIEAAKAEDIDASQLKKLLGSKGKSRGPSLDDASPDEVDDETDAEPDGNSHNSVD